MRNNFDKQLENLNVELIKMGALCEEAISLVAKVIEEPSEPMRIKIFDVDSAIDDKEREIEGICMKLLLQQQPVAKDLREISSALKMISDMERIGDQASDIGEILPFIKDGSAAGKIHIGDMASATIKMVTDSVESFVRKDMDMALSVAKYDDTVDELFKKVKSEIATLISKDISEAEYGLDLLMIAKYFERIGDHAVNIAEWVIYSISGVHKTF
ncbi:MAG: phosphate signaling complex protein PhoU [Eubacteriales bacterium]